MQDAEEIAILDKCSTALRQMKKDAEGGEFWMGRDDMESMKQSRSFIDRLSALTDLFVYQENRVLDIGGQQKEPKKKAKNDDNAEEFEFLNLSDLWAQWDDEDMRVCNGEEIVDEQNQRLLRNLRAYEVALTIIKQKDLKNAENKNAYLKVVEKAYQFLIKFVLYNKENQNIILDNVHYFLDDLEMGVHAVELICEVFRDNDCLLTYKLVPLIKRLATAIDHIDIESTKKATLLSFVPVFMKFKDTYLKENQYLILTEFTSSGRKNSNYLFTGK